MIIYQSTKKGFQTDILGGDFDSIVQREFLAKFNRPTSKWEMNSFRITMMFMSNILHDHSLPDDLGICIETQILHTSKRSDFIITGQDEGGADQAIIIELKHWESVALSDKDGLVETKMGSHFYNTCHPSYQAWSYAILINEYNEALSSKNIKLRPCVYLPNYEADSVITNEFYKEYLDKAPVFLKRDAIKLQSFLRTHFKFGDINKISELIGTGKVKPRKKLDESFSKILDGQREFILIDDQKVIFETALALSKNSSAKKKNVLIVDGVSCTGKSVVAIHILVEIAKRKKQVQYVTKNVAPRAIYQNKLAGTPYHSQFAALFQGSGAYTKCADNTFDTLIVDEAHLLKLDPNKKNNKGNKQVKDIIRASKNSVFFIDNDPRIALTDNGAKEELIKLAKAQGANVIELSLDSQFRKNEYDSNFMWLDEELYGSKAANIDLN
jgi:hypothetical protein